MALRPQTTDADRVDVINAPVETSRTYELFTTQMRTMVDGTDAVRQFIRKALITSRSSFAVYNADYGSEIDDLIGQGVNNALFDAELTRMIREALIYDDRISSVDNIVITRSGDECYVSFNVTLTSGAIISEEVTV